MSADVYSMDINHISVSRSDTYKQCPQKYKFRYHLKVPSGPMPDYLVYGKLVHKIIEEYTSAKGEKCINEIRHGCLNGDILLDEGKENEPKPREVLSNTYLTKLSKHLNSFLKLSNVVGLNGECEHKFEYDLDPPHGKKLVGFIDYIVQKDGNFLIVDYKTTKKSRWRKTKRNIAGDIQLQCYSFIVAEEFKVAPCKVRAALFYLEGEEFIGATFSQATLDKVKKYLLEMYNEIEASDPDKTRGRISNLCNYCDYVNICPFYSLTR